MDIVPDYNSISLRHIYDRNVKRKPPPQKLKNNNKTLVFISPPGHIYSLKLFIHSFIHTPNEIHPGKNRLMCVCPCVCARVRMCAMIITLAHGNLYVIILFHLISCSIFFSKYKNQAHKWLFLKKTTKIFTTAMFS